MIKRMLSLRPLKAAIVLVLALSGAAVSRDGAAAEGRAGRDLVVVEMFTSQSCSSCPPADALLGELARRKDVLALSMHVDYWNALGWRDPFSRADVTARQKDYMQTLGTRYVSTPQAIVQGRAYAVGSDRRALPRLIDQAKGGPGPRVLPRLATPGPGRMTVNLPDAALAGSATVWLIAFDDRHTARITGGENTGVTVTYTNVVRNLRKIGTWDGTARAIEVDVSKDLAAGYGNCAVLVQSGTTGPILGAVAVPMTPAGH